MVAVPQTEGPLDLSRLRPGLVLPKPFTAEVLLRTLHDLLPKQD